MFLRSIVTVAILDVKKKEKKKNLSSYQKGISLHQFLFSLETRRSLDVQK